jgi:RNA polymerase primary sigma factor
MFDTDHIHEDTALQGDEQRPLGTTPLLSDTEDAELDAGSLDAETLFSADLAATSLLTRAQEEALSRRISKSRDRVRRLLRGARRLSRAALADSGRGVIAPDEDFREREAVTILMYARAARRRPALQRATGMTRASLSQFVKQLEAALAEYRTQRDEMLRANLRLVNLFARRYHHPTLSSLDLFQEGTIGLMRAIEKYDPERNIKFSTYATWWIWQQLSRAADTYGSLIRMPVHWNQFRRRVSRDARDLANDNEGPVTREQMAASHGLDRERFEAMAQSFQFVSTDAPIGEDDDRTLESTLPAEEPEPIERAEQSSLRHRLGQALEQLPQRERIILRQRFGLNDDEPETLEQLGEQFGVSRERIRQLEARGLKLLKAICTRQGLKDYLH